jgi:putative membrane protein insertion efficiency factor
VLVYNTIFEKHQHKDDYSYAKNVDNEVEAIFSGLFLVYKYFFSSQDKASCVFEPSCSEYAIKSIQKKGIIIGGLQAIDRLSRCNGFSRNNYPIDPKTKQLYDPVE